MTRDSLAELYLWPFWAVIIAAGLLAFLRKDPALMRAAVICAAGQVFMEFAGMVGWARGAYLAMFMTSTLACLWRPSTRFLAILGGVNMAGVVFGAMHAMLPQSRVMLWDFLFIVSVAEVLVMAWGCGGGLVVNLVRRLRNRFPILGGAAVTGNMA
jgi:hypothetical protein